MSVVRKLSSFSLRNSSEYISNIFLSNKYVFKGKEEIVYKGGNKQTFLLNSVFKDVNSLGIIGWGPQAKAQACNLQDTFNLRNIDTKITIGLRNESKSIEKAKQAGFSTNTIENVSKESDLLLFLVSDSAQATMYKSVLSNMKKGATLGLSHGFLLGHMKNLDLNNVSEVKVWKGTKCENYCPSFNIAENILKKFPKRTKILYFRANNDIIKI